MRNARAPLALKPLSTVAPTDPYMFTPLVGGGAAINISDVERGNPTQIAFGSSPGYISGQWVRIDSAGGITDLNGTRKVLWVDGTGKKIAVDYDSSSSPAWTSGGTVNADVVYSRGINAGSAVVAGTLTNIWANKKNGLTFSNDNSVVAATATQGNEVFDLRGHTGRFIIAFDAYIVANSALSTTEFWFGIGKNFTAGNADWRAGHIAISLSTARLFTLTYRDSGTLDADTPTQGTHASNFVTQGDGSNALRSHVAFLLDFSGASVVSYAYANGDAKNSGTLTKDGADRPYIIDASGNGVLIGGRYGGANYTPSPTSLINDGGSGGRMRNFFAMKTDKSFGDCVKIIRDLYKYQTVPRSAE